MVTRSCSFGGIDTLARVYYEKGQLDEAIEWQKKAADQNSGISAIDRTLKQYETERAFQTDVAGVSPEDDLASVGEEIPATKLREPSPQAEEEEN